MTSRIPLPVPSPGHRSTTLSGPSERDISSSTSSSSSPILTSCLPKAHHRPSFQRTIVQPSTLIDTITCSPIPVAIAIPISSSPGTNNTMMMANSPPPVSPTVAKSSPKFEAFMMTGDLMINLASKQTTDNHNNSGHNQNPFRRKRQITAPNIYSSSIQFGDEVKGSKSVANNSLPNSPDKNGHNNKRDHHRNNEDDENECIKRGGSMDEAHVRKVEQCNDDQGHHDQDEVAVKRRSNISKSPRSRRDTFSVRLSQSEQLLVHGGDLSVDQPPTEPDGHHHHDHHHESRFCSSSECSRANSGRTSSSISPDGVTGPMRIHSPGGESAASSISSGRIHSSSIADSPVDHMDISPPIKCSTSLPHHPLKDHGCGPVTHEPHHREGTGDRIDSFNGQGDRMRQSFTSSGATILLPPPPPLLPSSAVTPVYLGEDCTFSASASSGSGLQKKRIPSFITTDINCADTSSGHFTSDIPHQVSSYGRSELTKSSPSSHSLPQPSLPSNFSPDTSFLPSPSSSHQPKSLPSSNSDQTVASPRCDTKSAPSSSSTTQEEPVSSTGKERNKIKKREETSGPKKSKKKKKDKSGGKMQDVPMDQEPGPASTSVEEMSPSDPSTSPYATTSREASSPSPDGYVPVQPKGVDVASASRLARRLYDLQGFRKSDVSRHLCKNNDFARVVAEEYVKHFDFTGDTLDAALRKFVSRFCLVGDTQDRERVLVHFSNRYQQTNSNQFKDSDALHTLTCALILLNTDLHAENVGRKMTCSEFIENLHRLPEGKSFSHDVLKSLYYGIKTQPLQWAAEDEESCNGSKGQSNLMSLLAGASDGEGRGVDAANPFLGLPSGSATEFKKGFIVRKCVVDPTGKKTPIGKRSWKRFYATLRDLVLYLHKDEHGLKKNQLYESLKNSIRIHHSLASKATDYVKREFVFRLQTADQAEYLFKAGDARELQLWIDAINFAAATLSAPPLAPAVGSDSTFQRPLLPVSHTKYTLREQLLDHEIRIHRLEQDLDTHLNSPPPRSTLRRVISEYTEKQLYFQYELKRFRTYSSLLKIRLQQTIGSVALEKVLAKSIVSSTSASAMSKSKPLTSFSIGEEVDDAESPEDEPNVKPQEPVIMPVKQRTRSHVRKERDS